VVSNALLILVFQRLSSAVSRRRCGHAADVQLEVEARALASFCPGSLAVVAASAIACPSCAHRRRFAANIDVARRLHRQQARNSQSCLNQLVRVEVDDLIAERSRPDSSALQILRENILGIKPHFTPVESLRHHARASSTSSPLSITACGCAPRALRRRHAPSQRSH